VLRFVRESCMLGSFIRSEPRLFSTWPVRAQVSWKDEPYGDAQFFRRSGFETRQPIDQENEYQASDLSPPPQTCRSTSLSPMCRSMCGLRVPAG